MEKISKRLVSTLFILVFFLMLMAARIGYIQIVRGDYYARKALAAGTEEISLEDYTRGLVLDRNLRPLSGLYKTSRVLVFREILEDRSAAARKLAPVTGAEEGALREMLSGRGPVLLPFSVTGKNLEIIRQYGLKGVLVVPYSFHYGPGGLAPHVVGYLGRVRDLGELEELSRLNGKAYRLSDWTGRQGLEYFYEKELKGLYPSGIACLYTDAAGRPLKGVPVMVNSLMGDSTRSDVVTTIDADIQALVERIMDRHIKKGAVVVMDTTSGDIIAMASRPDYNPDPAAVKPQSNEDSGAFVNQAISLSQPGSVFKIVVAAAALSEGIVAPDSLFFCGGAKELPLRCWKEEGHGNIDFKEAFAQSCNPVFVKLGRQLGPQTLIGYAKRLGLDNQTILGYPAASDGRQNLELIAGKYSLANSSVGQGPVLATPLQITAMTNTIASGGFYHQPRLVREVRPGGDPPRQIVTPGPERVLSPEVARQLDDLLAAVTKQGVGQKAWVSAGGSAGKTGSAQVSGEGGLVNAWFSGYWPLDKPLYTVTVMARESRSGGETAAPIFREIIEQIALLSFVAEKRAVK
ncbi:MAG: peptidoglycan D,D-transpeptidase FtsI family protein [Desulfocucumaceae bacterium]